MADENENKIIKKIKLSGTIYDIAATQVDASAVKAGDGNKLNSNAISGVSADTIIWTDATGKIPETAISGVSASKIQWTDADGKVPSTNQIPEGAISSVPASAISATDVLAENIIWTSGEGETEGYVPVPAESITSVNWNAVSGLKVDYSTDNMKETTGLMTPAEIQKAIDAQIATVYKVKGSKSWEELTAAGFSANNGDVYNLTGTVPASAKDSHNQKLEVGDNIVWVDSDNGWDKLGSSIEGYATEQWTKDYVSGSTSETTAQTIEKFDSLWKTTTAYVNSGITSGENGGASALWSGVEAYVGDQIQSEVWNKVVSGKEDIVEANSGKLATVGAISGYIEDQIESTIQETIDVAGYGSEKDTFINASGQEVQLSAIPNISAVTGWTDKHYIAKNDIYYGGIEGTDAYTLIIDNT